MASRRFRKPRRNIYIQEDANYESILISEVDSGVRSEKIRIQANFLWTHGTVISHHGISRSAVAAQSEKWNGDPKLSIFDHIRFEYCRPALSLKSSCNMGDKVMDQRKHDIIATAQQNFVVEIAETPDAIFEAQQLRFQVFCSERNIFAIKPDVSFEQDEFDTNSRHVVIRNRRSGEVVGTVRLVVATSSERDISLPMQRYCDANVFLNLPLQTTAEISRFALSKQRRSTNCPSDSLLRLGLMQGILRLSSELKLTHWCAVMERSLLRLLASAGVHFAAVGPMLDIYGLRQPSVAEISTVLTRGKRQCPDLYAFITNGISRPLSRPPELLAA